MKIVRNGEILFEGSKRSIKNFYEKYGAEVLKKTGNDYFMTPVFSTVEEVLKETLNNKKFQGGTLMNGMEIII